jgi:hypothetical protein
LVLAVLVVPVVLLAGDQPRYGNQCRKPHSGKP